MPEKVDYSQFYYRREKEEKKPSEEEKEKKPKKKRRFFGTVAVVLLCFALVFVCADFFGKGFLTEGLKKVFQGASYTYYVLAKPSVSRFTAYADSLEIKQKGGAGYVFCDDGYYVAYDVYPDKATALAVQKKNPSSTVYSLSYRTKQTDVAAELDLMVCDFSSALSSWEKGELTEGELTSLKNAYRTSLESRKPSCCDETCLSVLNLATDGLADFDFASCDKISVLSDMRYFLCCVVFSEAK